MNYLKGMLYMNEVLEMGGHKLFQPLPLRNNIIPKHIILDTAGLVSLFCTENTKKGELLKNITANQADIWNNFLNLKHPLFKNTHYPFHPDVGNSPPFWNESPFQTIPRNDQPRMQVETFE